MPLQRPVRTQGIYTAAHAWNINAGTTPHSPLILRVNDRRFWSQELLPAILLCLLCRCVTAVRQSTSLASHPSRQELAGVRTVCVLQFASAGVFTQLQDGLGFGDALYHCLITATTVGYGDVALSTQE